jgi:ribosome recycling factor
MNEELDLVIDMARDAMEKSVEHLRSDLVKVRAGKANPALLDGVSVDYYGSRMPLGQVSNVNTLDARTLSIQPWEKGMLEPIEKAISAANLGINPQNNGEMIILSIPPLTEERRKSLVKHAKTMGEDAKVGIRSSRKEANDEIKKLQKNGLPEDMAKTGETRVQKLTDDYITKVDSLVASKEKDILTV